MKQSWTRPEDLRAAEEAVRQAEEAVRSAKAQQRLDALYEQQVDQARSNLRATEAQLALARQALADAVIRSPFAGRIFERPAQPGAYLNPGTPVARVIGDEGMYFEGEAPEVVVTSIRAGSAVQVTIDALGKAPASGRVVSISPTSTEVARVYRVRIALDRIPEGARAGMFARGEIVLRRIEDAIVVPATALVSEGESTFVFVIKNGTAFRVRVGTGLRKNGLIQVDGVRAGQEIIVEGADDLIEGQKVKRGKPEPSSGKTAKAPSSFFGG
jgi:RND family efflux transporter MFP subunit